MNPLHQVAFRDLMRCLLAVLVHSALFLQPAPAESLRLLVDDTDALQTRFDLIDHAQRRIDCACFELRADDVSYAFLAHLSLAARRGVEVRLVVDAYGNQIPLSVLDKIIGDGVQVRRFHPFRLQNPHRFTRRMHDKLLVADRRVMILGGRNLGAVYFGRSAKTNFIDCDVEITGRVVGHASAYFEQLWTHDSVVPLRCCGKSNGRLPQQACQTFDSPVGVPFTTPAGLLRRGLKNVGADIQRKRSRLRSIGGATYHVPPARVRFLHTSRIAGGCSADITDEILALIDSSQREITIETPYLLLTRRFERSLRAAVQRGVHVRLLGNSLASIDKPVAHAGYVNQKKMMLRMGIDLWEYQGPDMLHAKTILIDDCAVVGSYDLHPRSEHYDTETAMVVSDARFTAAIRATANRHFAGAIRVGRRAGYRQSRGMSGSPRWMRIMKMQLLRLPALLLEKHL